MKGVSIEENEAIKQKVGKPMIWIAIISICMLFGGLTSAYVVRSGDPGWTPIILPTQFYISAILMLLSSLTLYLALLSAQKDLQYGIKAGVSITFLLGLGFVWSQLSGWSTLVDQGIVMGGKHSHPAGQFLYVLSLAHILHVLGGIIVLIYVGIKTFRGLYHSKKLLGLQLCSIYWHFLDLLWIYLLMFMYFSN